MFGGFTCLLLEFLCYIVLPRRRDVEQTNAQLVTSTHMYPFIPAMTSTFMMI